MTVAGRAWPYRSGLLGGPCQTAHGKRPSDSQQVGGKARNECSKEANSSLIQESSSALLILITFRNFLF